LAVQSVQARLRVIPKGLAMAEAYPGRELCAPGRGGRPARSRKKCADLAGRWVLVLGPGTDHRGLSG